MPHYRVVTPFVLNRGTNLIIPPGIKFGSESNGYREIPLRIFEKKSQIYDFLHSGSTDNPDLSLFVPTDGIKRGILEVSELNIDEKFARARIM